jgi:hypothetical protein
VQRKEQKKKKRKGADSWYAALCRERRERGEREMMWCVDSRTSCPASSLSRSSLKRCE